MNYVAENGALNLVKGADKFFNSLDADLIDLIEAAEKVRDNFAPVNEVRCDEWISYVSVVLGVLFGIDLNSAEEVLDFLGEPIADAEVRNKTLSTLQHALYAAAKSSPALSEIVGEFKGMNSDSMDAARELLIWDD